MVYEGITTDGIRRVLLDAGDASIVVESKVSATEWITVLVYKAPNLRVLAEHLSDAVGYGQAVALLTEWQIDPDHPLWTLNHKGGQTHWSN
jgi:hypothetical protein